MTNEPMDHLDHPQPDPVRDLREQREHQDELDAWKRRWRTALFGLAAFFITALGLVGLYAYSVGHRPDSSPERITALEQRVDGVNRGIDSRMASWNQDRDSLRSEMEQTGHDLLRRFEIVKKQTGESLEAMSHKLQAQVDTQLNGLSAKIDGLENSRDADRAQVASLKQELSQVRGQLDSQAKELAVTREKVDAAGANAQLQIARLRDNTQNIQETANRARQEAESVNNRISTDRVDFEVVKNQVKQIAPGISMNITGFDLPYHRVTGWVWVMPDRRTIWLRKQSTADPVVFYGKDDKKRELIITGLTKNSASGYWLLPKGSLSAAALAAVQQ